MDPLTHGLMGAAIGQAAFGRTLGKRALAWGAFGAMLPDIDVALIPFAGPMGEWTYHRGLTHSVLVAPLVAWALAAFASRRTGVRAGFRPWFLLFLATLMSHPLLDLCTTYGTQLFAPLSRHRFALDAIAIVDPAYSLMFVLALLAGWLRGPASRPARVAAATALVLSTAYLLHGLGLNARAEALARRQLEAEGIRATEVRAYPTLLQLYLRRVVAREAGAVRVGWISLWRPRPIAWERFALPEDRLVDAARHTAEGRLFEWFALGQTAAAVLDSATGKIVEIDDLRYGLPAQPRSGLWGIRVRFDSDGRPVGPVERVDHPLPAPARVLLAQIWRETFPP
jgi:inner membrane protein